METQQLMQPPEAPKHDLEQIRQQYPLHYLIWSGNNEELQRQLLQAWRTGPKPCLERKDPHGRSPLMFAITLGRSDCVRTLLSNGARVDTTDATGFTPIQEAISNASIVKGSILLELVEKSTFASLTSQVATLNQAVRQLVTSPNFYIELRFDFSTWLYCITGGLPSDTYRLYKREGKIRLDTSLVQLDHSGRFPRWFRGSRSYIFDASAFGCTIYELDHIERWIKRHTYQVRNEYQMAMTSTRMSRTQIAGLLSRPIFATTIEGPFLERAQTFGTNYFDQAQPNRVEQIGGYKSRLYIVKDLKLRVADRYEHLGEKARELHRQQFWLVDKLGKMLGVHIRPPSIKKKTENPATAEPSVDALNPYNLDLISYFNSDADSCQDIGVAHDYTTVRTKSLKTRFWLAQNYPLKVEQVMPILDLLSMIASPMSKFSQFLEAKFPVDGFPIKTEISAPYMMKAKLEFANLFGTKQSVDGVKMVHSQTAGALDQCQVDESCFELPTDYISLPTTGSCFNF